MENQPRPPRLVRHLPWLTPALIIGLAVLIGGIRGIYTIGPGEAAALQTFGAARPTPVTAEGLHWHWPPPVGRTTVIQITKSRTAAIGYRELPEGKTDLMTGEGWQRDLDAATMITGDLNLVEVQLVAQYRIDDLNHYLFGADDPGVAFSYVDGDRNREYRSHPPGRPDGQSIRDALEIAVRRAMGHRTIDEALVSDRETVELETRTTAQQILDDYQTGLLITAIQLQEVKAPDEVQAAFDDVLRAREEKDTRINQAIAHESKVLPEAKGDASRLVSEAEAYREERIQAAQGEADRFVAILNEYRAQPAVIMQRIYLETLDRVLPHTNLTIADAGPNPVIVLDAGAGESRPIPLPATPP